MLYFRRFFVQLMLTIVCVGLSSNAYSEELTGVVKDDKGEAVVDAVVYAVPLSGSVVETTTPKSGIVDQVDKEFVPYVLSVQVGTEISFPNSDRIRHHVYSFSPAKTFEIPLYATGDPSPPIVFDKPGVITLGCNIHDWMKAYVYVLETPFFAKTDDNGRATIADLSPGEYDVQVWHPRIKKSSEKEKQRMSLAQGNSTELEFTIKLNREWRAMRAPKAGGGKYR